MRGLEKTMDTEAFEIWEAMWGAMHVGYESYRKDFDVAPFLKGLPEDRCQSRHWGVVMKGRVQVAYADHTETFEAGQAYYAHPGHSVSAQAGTQLYEFSPKQEYGQTAEAVARNLEAAKHG
jgi:hypothetical protein